ncbi:SDR family NAD(P)-dependent oxidoreductase [Amycolatopsis sp. YIM 10]|uniref:SDR family NAD(P)-dependent oxidoreductase n=1 Tax=Amycolatopsis sp. YIM 10 TaxID=2653857 RepID=UPI00129083D8|nr:SDR family NAD(P)-dependent oxidoreductase [Amycolatopsis sp. YIM 10]QFU93894.1 Cyclic-di-GMP-binding biofilm dispersal mediator protein [Amycolatopsis sp. YIM 10]
MSTLDGRTALVTGGSRGIGAAIATRLAAEGANVALTYTSAADRAASVATAIEGLGRKSLAIQADSADPAALTAAVDQAAEALGGLDILVNNAGIFPTATIEEVSLEQIDHTFAVHVRAVFVAAQAALKHMGEGGRIVTIGSNLAERVPWPGLSLYSASKSALLGLTRGLARDLGPRGIAAVLVQPGSTDTDMNPANGDHADGQRQLSAYGEFMKAGDIAATVAHLAGDAGRFLTGSAVTIDSGTNA